MHAEHLGFGMQSMEQEGLYWVLTRQTLHMQEWPRFSDKLQIQTWLRPPEGAFITREFTISTENKKIGQCSTSWLALDKQTKKPLAAQNLRPLGKPHLLRYDRIDNGKNSSGGWL